MRLIEIRYNVFLGADQIKLAEVVDVPPGRAAVVFHMIAGVNTHRSRTFETTDEARKWLREEVSGI